MAIRGGLDDFGKERVFTLNDRQLSWCSLRLFRPPAAVYFVCGWATAGTLRVPSGGADWHTE